jgi:CRISPR-associated endonuclease/helicase Cas3
MRNHPDQPELTAYWAHSDLRQTDPGNGFENWQRLRTHLVEVGKLAREFGLECSGREDFARRAEAAGLLHDLGKYQDKFQKLLHGEVKSAPHSIYGAAAAYWKSDTAGVDVSFAVAGHHGGMPDLATLKDRIKQAKEDTEALWRRAAQDSPELLACFAPPEPLLPRPESFGLEFEFQTRMLLSCLVDADRENTAQHAGNAVPRGERLRGGELLKRLLSRINERSAELADGAVKQARASVLLDCLSSAAKPGTFFSLTVPTGGGKTLSSMAFALRRAELFPGIRRVIVVIPYLSIIEQNAAVFRDALGVDILEHHSAAFGVDGSDEAEYENPTVRAARENWDAPIVVTTSVRFFETLFSNHPRDIRRLHNIARSVVILDEIQTLPRHYLHPTLSILEELGQRWGVTFVFSTATQPALEKPSVAEKTDLRWRQGTLIEIIGNVRELFSQLRRVETDWRSGTLSWEQVAEELRCESQALVIVNTRIQARVLGERLEQLGRPVVHLSTNLCPAHRRRLLNEIREELQANRPCLVVSTQLVEAGVDLDFPLVWRALGPLDSIAQAAGRCDREGKLTRKLGRPGGRFVVFQPVEKSMPRGAYKEGAERTESMFRAGELDWESPDVMRSYFHRLYRDSGDSQSIQEMRRSFLYAKVASTVNWIDDDGYSVLVPYDEDAERLLEEIRFAGVSLGRFRRAQAYTVNLPIWESNRARAIGSVYELAKGVWACRAGLYHERWGIQIEGRGGVI